MKQVLTHLFKKILVDVAKEAKTDKNFQICVIQRRDMDAPVDSSCLETTEVSRKTKIRLGLINKPAIISSSLPEEGDIEELLKSVER